METKIKKQKYNLKKGFTLIELLITIVIFVILTGVVLLNSNTFDNTILLNNLSYDIALTIKEAQSYGVNVAENSQGLFNTKTQAYGVYFNLDKNNTNFILFNDLDSNHKYEDGDITNCLASNSECIQKYTMRNGTHISGICVGSSESDCEIHNGITELSILFYRPNLNAVIHTFPETIPPPTYAKITLSAANTATSSIVITSIGQIYVKK